MAITYGFFDSDEGDRLYSAADLTDYFLRLIPDGVAGGLEVTKISGLVAQISVGWAFIRARWVNISAPETISFAASAETQRIDRVFLRLNLAASARNISIVIREGTSTSPPIPVNTEIIAERPLARVTVGAEGIVDITDERVIVQGFGAFGGLRLRHISPTAYAALTVKDPNTLYVVDPALEV